MVKIIHFFAYYIVWFGSLFLAKHNSPWFALLLSFSISMAQIGLLVCLTLQKRLLIFLSMFCLIGFTIDTVFSITGITVFSANPWQGYLAPPRILGMWFNFAVICFVIRGLLARLLWLMPIVAALGFPMAYAAGVTLGVATFGMGALSMAFIGLAWMVAFPIVFSFCNKSDPLRIKTH